MIFRTDMALLQFSRWQISAMLNFKGLRNQHHRLLPAMCHNLCDGSHGPPATVLTTPGLLER